MPVHTISLLFLLSEELHRQPRAVYKYWVLCRLCWEVTYAVRCFSLWPLVSGSHLFAVCFDSGYMLRQFTAASVGDDFLELLVFSAMLDSTVAPEDDFFELFVFSAMLGSTVAPGADFVKCSVFSAMLGSTVALGDDYSSMAAACARRVLPVTMHSALFSCQFAGP